MLNPSRTLHARKGGSSDRPRASSTGFSLIELLLVMLVIGILTTILIPVVGSVRESRNTSMCAGNLRQIGVAMFSHANDHDGRLPKAVDGTSWPSSTFMYQLEPYINDRRPVSFNEIQQVCFDGLFRCPGKEDWSLAGPTDMQKISYGMNSFYTEGVLEEGMRLMDIEDPARTLLVADYEQGWWVIRNSAYMYRDFSALRHSGEDNVLFCDGHVALVPKNGLDNRLVLR